MKPFVWGVILFVVIVITEMFGPEFGPIAVWGGRAIAGIILIYMAYKALGGEGFGALLVAALVIIGAGTIWVFWGEGWQRSLVEIALVALPILLLIDLITAFADIFVGFRYEDYALIIAGALAGLMALGSAWSSSLPPEIDLLLAVLALIVGAGSFLKRSVYEVFG